MKHLLTALAAISALVLSACDTTPVESAIESPVPTAESLAESGTLGDWARAADDEKSAFLETVSTTHANAIMKSSPSTTADDAMTATVTYFRQCMDSFSYSGVDEQATTVPFMLARCEARFDPADAQRFLDRVYQAKNAAGAASYDTAWTTPPPAPAKKTDDELCQDPCFGE